MDTVLGHAEVMLVVGSWPAVRLRLDHLEHAHLTVKRMEIRFVAARVRQVEQAVAALRPSWLLLADGLDDEEVATLMAAGRAVDPDLRTAMLGPPDDVERCLRWTRRCCSVYLVNSASAERVVRCIRLSYDFQLVVIDECFYAAARRTQIDPIAPLTPRERDVLRLLRRGLRNAEMARELHVSESTVEFHVRHLLEKFAARNRTEIIERAIRSGL
jgi:DNA-binding NarL/FixJ family response regulator